MLTGDDWSDCFTLKDISLPTNPFIGLSAMTGDVTDAHEYAPSAKFSHSLSYLT
jgi:mannose-binding lectin 2